MEKPVVNRKADGLPILIRPTKAQRAKLDAVVAHLQETASLGARYSLSGFMLDLALREAERLGA